MKTAVLVAFGVVSLALVAAAQKPDPAKPAPDASKQTAPKQDPQQLKALGYSSPASQKAATQVAPTPAPAAAPTAGAKPGQAVGGPVGDDLKVRSRNVATMVVNVERAHRDRVARLERLRQIYEKSGSAEQLEKVARLSAKERARYDAAMRGYERDLGPALFAKLRSALDLNAGQPPATPPPSAAPAPAPQGTPDAQKPDRGGARQKGRR